MSNIITCKIDGCFKPSFCKSLCSMHYTRLHRYGLVENPTPSTEQRFWAKVNKTDSCWLWTASTNNGYGQFNSSNGTLAHRYAYELANGPIPAGLHIDHLCRVRTCVNPIHLEAVTPAENNRRVALNRTHCRHGHPYSGDNLFLRKDGRRECRTCMGTWNKKKAKAKNEQISRQDAA